MTTNKKRIKGYADANKKAISLYSLARIFSFIRDACIFYWLISSIIAGKIDVGDFYMFFTAILAFINFNDEYTWIISNMKMVWQVFPISLPLWKITLKWLASLSKT